MAKTATATPATATPSVAVKKPARYAESDVITLLRESNPKRAASAKRYACYKTGMTVGEYLDACAALHPDEPRYRWRADLTWDVAREFISVAPASK